LTGSPPASLTHFVVRTCCHCELVFLAGCIISSDGETDCSNTEREEISTAHLSQPGINRLMSVGCAG